MNIEAKEGFHITKEEETEFIKNNKHDVLLIIKVRKWKLEFFVINFL